MDPIAHCKSEWPSLALPKVCGLNSHVESCLVQVLLVDASRFVTQILEGESTLGQGMDIAII